MTTELIYNLRGPDGIVIKTVADDFDRTLEEIATKCGPDELISCWAERAANTTTDHKETAA